MNEKQSNSGSNIVNLNLYIRPLLWDRSNSDPECNGGYDWGIHGSGILLRYNNLFYFICTRHSFRDNEDDDFNSAKVPISFRDASFFLPLKKCFYANIIDNPECIHHRDILIFTVDIDLLKNKKISNNDFCDVFGVEKSILSMIKPGVTCILVGCPNETSIVDIEHKK